MKYILLVALFWHATVTPSDVTRFIKKSFAACFSITKKILNNDKHTNYALASAAVIAGATSLFYSVKKMIERVSTLGNKPKLSKPLIAVTHLQKLNPVTRKKSLSIIIRSGETTPLASPCMSRTHSRKNSESFPRASETSDGHWLISIPEDEDEVHLHVSVVNNEPLAEEEIAMLQRIANQTPKNERQKRRSQKALKDIYQSELSEMIQAYNKMKKSAPPVVKETKIGLWWLQWVQEKGGDDPIERLVLTFNGEEIDVDPNSLEI